MPRPIPLAVAVLALSCAGPLTGPVNQYPEPIIVAALAPHDQLRVSLHSHGCFHDVSATLSFEGVEDGARVTGSVTGNYTQEVELLIDRTLDRQYLGDLDAWMAYYRNLPRNVGCTTVTELDFALYRDGRLVRRERYRDDTCGALEPPSLPERSFYTLTRAQ